MNTTHRILTLLCGVLFLSLTAGAVDNAPTATKTFQVKKGGKLSVHINGGDIRVTPSAKDEVSVQIRGLEDDDEMFDVRQEGNNVVVENQARAWSGNSVVSVAVPARYDLDLSTSQGAVRVDGNLAGKVDVETSAGDIRIGDVTGVVDAKTSGGQVTVGDVDGDIDLGTSGGDITSGEVKGKARIVTSGGSITTGDVTKELVAKTAGGDVRVGNVGGSASINTAGGNISAGKVAADATLQTAGGDIDLDAATGHVKANTAGGDLRLNGITGSINGKTAGGDIEVELTPRGSESSRLATAGGDVRFYIADGAKATIKATIRISERWKHAKDEFHINSAFKADSYVTDPETHEIHATYNVNGGGTPISLETVNADISIRTIGEHSTKGKAE